MNSQLLASLSLGVTAGLGYYLFRSYECDAYSKGYQRGITDLGRELLPSEKAVQKKSVEFAGRVWNECFAGAQTQILYSALTTTVLVFVISKVFQRLMAAN